MSTKPKKGQVLYIVAASRLYGGERKNGEYEYYGTPVAVVKVGREYFYIAREGWESEECKNTWTKHSIEAYNAGRTNIYESWEHYFEDGERKRLRGLITNSLPSYGTVAYSYQQLRAVADILEIQ